MIRRRLGAVLALVAVSALGSAVAAHAADDDLLVSHDGTRFVAESTTPLFDDIGRVVPGDAHTRSLWVRNTAEQSGRLRIDLVDVTTDDRALADAVSVSVSVDDVESAPVSITRAAQDGCYILIDMPVIAPDATVRVDARLAVDQNLGSAVGDDGREGTNGRFGFGLRASLADPSAPEAPPGTCVPVPHETASATANADGALPATGNAVPLVAILAAGGAVIAGLALRTARSKER